MKKVVIEAPAKINLTLGVKRKRADGYHEIESVMHHINLLDRVHMKMKSEEGITVNSDSRLIPEDKNNLAYQAAELILGKNGLKEGVEIFIEKRIPVGAGLAGGSTDAAAVLRGINSLMGLGLERDALMELGAELGSDVPFCLMDGSALARGRGELLTPLPKTAEMQIVLVKPDFQLSTAQVYGGLVLEKVRRFPDIGAFLAAWTNYDIINIAREMENVLETVSIEKCPQIAVIKRELIQLGALNALMSGSGPSVFAVFAEEEKAAYAYHKLKSCYQEAYLLRSYY